MQLPNHVCMQPVWQVHCVAAFAELQSILRQEGGFEAGLILHSWMGPQHLVPALAAIQGVHFSISGRSLRSDKRAPAMLKQVLPDASAAAVAWL